MAELARQHDVELVWLPYELRPEPAPLPNMTGDDLETARGRWQQGVAPLAERFGVTMSFPPIKPRSRRAHEAAEFARDHDQFDAMRTALFVAYFVENRDLDDVGVLADVAARVGLDGAALRAALDAGSYTARVVELESVAHQLGVRAVPTMVFGDYAAVEGAQPYPVLRRAYEIARERERAEEVVPPA